MFGFYLLQAHLRLFLVHYLHFVYYPSELFYDNGKEWDRLDVSELPKKNDSRVEYLKYDKTKYCYLTLLHPYTGSNLCCSLIFKQIGRESTLSSFQILEIFPSRTYWFPQAINVLQLNFFCFFSNHAVEILRCRNAEETFIEASTTEFRNNITKIPPVFWQTAGCTLKACYCSFNVK